MSNKNLMVLALLAVTMTAAAQQSASSPQNSQPVAATQTSQTPPATMDQVVDRVILRDAHSSPEPAIDTGGPMGKMVLTVLGMVAEMELSFLKERQRAGIEAAKAKGVYKGRPPTFDHAKIVALRKQGKGATEIARAVGCQRGNVYKALKASGLK